MSHSTQPPHPIEPTSANNGVETPIADRMKQLAQDLQQELDLKQQEIDRLQQALASLTEKPPACESRRRTKKRPSIVKVPLPMRIKQAPADPPTTKPEKISQEVRAEKTQPVPPAHAAKTIPKPCLSQDLPQRHRLPVGHFPRSKFPASLTESTSRDASPNPGPACVENATAPPSGRHGSARKRVAELLNQYFLAGLAPRHDDFGEHRRRVTGFPDCLLN